MANLVRPPPLALAPARNLRDVTRNCDEDVPLQRDDPRWQDFSPARGGQATAALLRQLQERPQGGFVHAAFVGPRGAGKSTEILRLAERLRDAYEPVYIEATFAMDPFQIEAEDLLLNIALSVEAQMRACGRPLPEDLLERVRRWFDDVVSTTEWARNFNVEAVARVEAKPSALFAGGLFGSLKALFRHESEYRTEIKQVLRKYPGTLLQSVNDVLDAANWNLGGRALLVIIDNLDRYSPEVIDRLLVSGADRIRKLRTNLILTPPVTLQFQPRSAQSDTLYRCHFLDAVRLRSPDMPYDRFEGPGRDLMEEALARRVDLDTMLPEKTARDRLIAASGGAIRELLQLVSRAALGAAGDVITEADAERAVAQRRQRLRDQINANGWLPELRKVAETKQLFPEEKPAQVLFHHLAFKYNGEGWYDVHPLVSEIPEFVRGCRGAGR